MSDRQDITAEELRLRVLFSLLGPVVALADRFGVSLKELTEWTRLAYFRHLRDAGLGLAEVAERLDVSERTAKTLSRQLRESFFLPEREHNLPTRIEFMLWRQPMSEGRLKQVLPDDREAVEEALVQLLEQQRIAPVRDDGDSTVPTYAPTQSVNSQIGEAWVKRIGSLNSLMGNLHQVVQRRFFGEDARAFARTLTFMLRPEGFGALERLFLETLVPAIAALDEEAAHGTDEGSDEAVGVKLSLLWAPEDEGRSREDD